MMAQTTSTAQAMITGRQPQNGGLSLQPQNGMSVGMAAEQQRAMAEVQSMLIVAASRPRDERAAIDRISRRCSQPKLAEVAEYQFQRGGTDITGPSIRLMECVAGAWGNINYGFRILHQTTESSLIEAFAWDLETNVRVNRTFDVPHYREKKNSAPIKLTDPRDVYETIANFAQRRVRACLEEVIPDDIVQEAVDAVHETLKSSCPVTTDSIKKLIDSFVAMGVTKEQIEVRLQRRIDAITPAQFATFRRIYTSIKDGLSEAKDWFEDIKKVEQAGPSATQQAMLEPNKKEAATEPESAIGTAVAQLNKVTTQAQLTAWLQAWSPANGGKLIADEWDEIQELIQQRQIAVQAEAALSGRK